MIDEEELKIYLLFKNIAKKAPVLRSITGFTGPNTAYTAPMMRKIVDRSEVTVAIKSIKFTTVSDVFSGDPSGRSDKVSWK